jgi:hypothetical protein
MGEIDRELRRLRRYQSQVDRRLAALEMKGRVAAVDDAKRKCRVEIGKTADGEPVLSPWVQWAEPRSGAHTSDHTPMRIGDPVTVRSPSGILGASSIAHRDGYSGDRPAPSTAADAAVEKTGALTISRRADGLEIDVDGTSWRFTAAGLKQTGGTIEHDDHLIDKSHKHTDVEPGSALSGPPA